jgi:hypothetical protein
MEKTVSYFIKVQIFAAAFLILLPLQGIEITRGPYLQRPKDDSILLVWEQDKASSPQIKLSCDGDIRYIKTSKSTIRHEVSLNNLKKGQKCSYSIVNEGMEISKTHTFNTMPIDKTAFSFVVMGDTRSDPEAHSNIISEISGQDIHFFVNTGDLVADGEVDSQWTDFFNIEQPLMSQATIFPVIGNHDEHDGKAELFCKYFVNPESSSNKEEYYSVDYSNVHLVILDGHAEADEWYLCSLRGLMTDDCFNEKQEAWLKKDIAQAHANPDIDHILVFVHAGPYTSKEGRTGNLHMRNLLDFFAQNNVSAIISGHDHYYERGTSGNGIPYIISGGGGAPLYEVESPNIAPHKVHKNLMDYHYLYITSAGKYLNIESRRLGGEVFDGIEIGNKPDCITSEDCEDKTLTGCSMPLTTCEEFSCTTICTDEAPDEENEIPDIKNDNEEVVDEAEDSHEDIKPDNENSTAPEVQDNENSNEKEQSTAPEAEVSACSAIII